MEQAGNPVRYADVEIDLRELFANLWAERLLILLVTLLVGGAAAAYAFLSTPVYEAKSSLLPPRLSDIAGYNLGRGNVQSSKSGSTAQADLATFTVGDVYAVFTRNLLSDAARRDFFRDIYLPSLDEKYRSAAEDALWEKFNKEVLSAKAPDVKSNPDYFEVRVEHKDPAIASEWANLFVQRASERSLRDMQRNVRSEVATRMQNLEQQIEVLRNTALKRRHDRIAQLTEALSVAEAVGQEQPLITTLSANSSGELSSFLDGSLMYMRGAKAIRAELQVLQARKSDDPFIPELRELQDRLELLQRIDVKPDNIAVFTLDSAAEMPETPIKPRKALILAIGILLGGMLGVFISLVRCMLGKSRSTSV